MSNPTLAGHDVMAWHMAHEGGQWHARLPCGPGCPERQTITEALDDPGSGCPHWRTMASGPSIAAVLAVLRTVKLARRFHDVTTGEAAALGTEDASAGRPPLYCGEQAEDGPLWEALGVTETATEQNAPHAYALMEAYAGAYDAETGRERAGQGWDIERESYASFHGAR